MFIVHFFTECHKKLNIFNFYLFYKLKQTNKEQKVMKIILVDEVMILRNTSIINKMELTYV